MICLEPKARMGHVSTTCYCVCAELSPSVVSHSFVAPWTVAHQSPPSMGFFR